MKPEGRNCSAAEFVLIPVSKTFITILSWVTGQAKQQNAHWAGLHIPGGQHSMSSISQVISSSVIQHSVSPQIISGAGAFIRITGAVTNEKKEKRRIYGKIFTNSNLVKREQKINRGASLTLFAFTRLRICLINHPEKFGIRKKTTLGCCFINELKMNFN